MGALGLLFKIVKLLDALVNEFFACIIEVLDVMIGVSDDARIHVVEDEVLFLLRLVAHI